MNKTMIDITYDGTYKVFVQGRLYSSFGTIDKAEETVKTIIKAMEWMDTEFMVAYNNE